MCELLGLNFNQSILPTFSFAGLLKGTSSNRDGWGLGFYDENCRSATIYKEPITANSSQLAKFLFSYGNLYSKLFIAHIRKSSKGGLFHDNCHPFSRYYAGLEWLFAHNGTLHSKQNLSRLSFIPTGQTDSERAFCFLMSQLRKKRITPIKKSKYSSYSQADFRAIFEILLNINEKGDGAFNTLFSDSEHLFCYRDIYGERPLYYLERKYPFRQTVLRDSDLQINLNLEKGMTEEGCVVASSPLSTEDWISFDCGQLIVFRNGQKVADIGIDDDY